MTHKLIAVVVVVLALCAVVFAVSRWFADVSLLERLMFTVMAVGWCGVAWLVVELEWNR